jgi:hypothetical protein
MKKLFIFLTLSLSITLVGAAGLRQLIDSIQKPVTPQPAPQAPQAPKPPVKK